MKIYVLSDLHTECKPFLPDPQATEEAEVIVLAGDIHPGVDGIIWARKAFADRPIVYIAGNHEFYGQHWDDLLGQLRETARAHDIHFLENETAMIKGVRFLGCTLWTDFEFFEKSRRSQCMRAVENALADYDAIDAEFLPPNRVAAILGTPCSKKDEKSWSAKLTPVHTLDRHQASRAWLQSELAKGNTEKTVVVTHHYPHKNSTAVRYSKDLVTAGFGSSLPLDMLCQASLWIHGHTHESCNYRIGDSARSVRVVCNPRGYPRGWHDTAFENATFDERLLVEFEVPESIRKVCITPATARVGR